MEKIIFEEVGKRLKLAREKNKITLEEAGNKVGVHKSTILRWENGETEKIKLPMLETLANYYNVNPVWLAGYDVPMEKETSTTDFRYANHNGTNTEGLDDNDIDEINRFVEFIRNKKKNEGK